MSAADQLQQRFVDGVGGIVIQYLPDPNTERQLRDAKASLQSVSEDRRRAWRAVQTERQTRIRLERKLQSRRAELRKLAEIRRYEHDTELVLAKALSDIIQRPGQADEIAGTAVLEWIRRRGPRNAAV